MYAFSERKGSAVNTLVEANNTTDESPSDANIVTDVDRLIREVPAFSFSGPIREVAQQLREFEDEFCFVPVMKPKVEGDFYLASRYKVEDPAVLPEYSQTSDFYYLLKSYNTLEPLADGLGDHIQAHAHVQKQVSVALYDPNVSEDVPLVYYVNSYNRSTREKIIMGFALLSYTYIHRRSGTHKDDFETITQFLSNEESYTEAMKLLMDYPVGFNEFKQACKKAGVPLKRVAYHMFGINKELWQEAFEKGNTERLLFNAFKSRYGNEEGRLCLTNLIQWFHDLYHFNTKSGRFDVATKTLDLASGYLTKSILPKTKLLDII